MPSASTTARFLLPLLSFFAIYAVSSIMQATGYAAAFQVLNEPGPHFLPGGTEPLVKTYTGLAPLDHYFSSLQLVFVHVLDGSALELSLLGVRFGGSLFGVFGCMCVEAVEGRRGGKGAWRGLVSVCLWGLGIQYAGYFLVMPWYCFTQLQRSRPHPSSTTSKTTARDIQSLGAAMMVLPWSLTLGYVGPTILICIPTFSSQTRQYLLAFWQNFPFWVVLLQLLFESIIASLSTPMPYPQAQARYQTSLRRVYKLAFAMCAMTHIITISIVTTAFFKPHMFDPNTARALQPWNVLVPPRWDRKEQIQSLAEGAQNFLLWDYYVGTGAAVLWAIAVAWDRGTGNGTAIVRRGVGWLAIGGLGGVVVGLMGAREEWDKPVIEGNEGK